MVKPPNHFGKRAVSELGKCRSICIRGSAILLFLISIFLLALTFCSTHDCSREAIIQLHTFSFILNYLYHSIYLCEAISMKIYLLSEFYFQLRNRVFLVLLSSFNNIVFTKKKSKNLRFFFTKVPSFISERKKS